MQVEESPESLHVFVFVPYEGPVERLVSPGYDTPEYRVDVDGWFEALGIGYEWVAVGMGNVRECAARARVRARRQRVVVLNLCDGDEANGYPGISVLRALEAAGLPYSGGAEPFYAITSSKIASKRALARAGVPSAPFVTLEDVARDPTCLERTVGVPAIVKPDASAASFGISLRSVVRDAAQALAHGEALLSDPAQRDTARLGLFAERFIEGPEFTVLVVSDATAPAGVRTLVPVERVFHSALPASERFLSYDRYWSYFTVEDKPPEGEPFYRYRAADPALQPRLRDVAIAAYRALDGTGYARVDLRLSASDDTLYVLEVNANCGLSSDTETSVGQILAHEPMTASALIALLLEDAWRRKHSEALLRPALAGPVRV